MPYIDKGAQRMRKEEVKPEYCHPKSGVGGCAAWHGKRDGKCKCHGNDCPNPAAKAK